MEWKKTGTASCCCVLSLPLSAELVIINNVSVPTPRALPQAESGQGATDIEAGETHAESSTTPKRNERPEGHREKEFPLVFFLLLCLSRSRGASVWCEYILYTTYSIRVWRFSRMCALNVLWIIDDTGEINGRQPYIHTSVDYPCVSRYFEEKKPTLFRCLWLEMTHTTIHISAVSCHINGRAGAKKFGASAVRNETQSVSQSGGVGTGRTARTRTPKALTWR